MGSRNLVGRARELEELDQLIDRCIAGERTVAAITGEPGIGKTRLLDALAVRAAGHGGVVAWGQATELGPAQPYWPWIHLVHALETDTERAPALGTLDPNASATTRAARFAEVAGFLARRATQPLALLFDDLHAADVSSLQLLEYVIPALAGKRVLFALTARDNDSPPEVASLLARLLRGAQRIPLARLSRGDVATLVGGRADVERVFSLSEGNPLFVEEVVSSVERDGTLRLSQLSGAGAVIRDRIAKLPSATADALVAAAIVGREFRGQVVAAMCGAAELGDRLRPALHGGIVAMTAPDGFRFSHALLAESLVADLDPLERGRLHAAAARVIEQHDPMATSTIAHHLLAAGPAVADAAVTAAVRAARDAIARLAFADAVVLLDRAHDALRLAAPANRQLAAQLACLRAEALQHAGEHRKAAEVCLQAAELARALDDPELFAQIVVARGLEMKFALVDDELVEMLREALDRLDSSPSPLRARLLARYAAALQPAHDPEVPARHAREAIAMGRALPDLRDRLAILYTATGALVDYLPPDEMEILHDEVHQLARWVGDRPVAVHTLLRRCFVDLERADRIAFDRDATAFASLARSLGIPRWTRYVHMLDAMAAVLEGRRADAETAAAAFEEIVRASDDRHSGMLLDIHRGIAGSAMTCPEPARLRAQAAIAGHGRTAVLALAAVEANDLDEARALLATLDDPVDGNLTVMAVLAVIYVGDRTAAARYYDRLLPRGGQVVVASMVGFAVQDLMDRLLLLLATRCERWDAIEAHAESGLAIAARLASPPWAARVRADWADALDLRAHPGDRDRARELWSAALREAERMRMEGLAARCGAALGERPAAPPPPPTSTIRCERHGELWTIRGLGDEIHVKASRGLTMLAKLVAEPHRELHALELGGGSEAADGGDAGEVLDAMARARYRARIAELVEERDRAEAWNDHARAERASAELDALTEELARAVGLGGRSRRVGGAAERARSNVQRRIAHAIHQIEAASPRLGAHFAAAIRTGTLCVYAPPRS